jgi:hypothetical protein
VKQEALLSALPEAIGHKKPAMGRVGDFMSRCFWRREVHTAQAASIQLVYIQARLWRV